VGESGKGMHAWMDGWAGNGVWNGWYGMDGKELS
jgi:hypothetical protein